MTVNRWQATDERRAELVVEFKRGKVIEMGPSVDDYKPDMGQQITDEINADPEEVERLRQARLSARQGDTVPLREALADNDFFEEDEPVEDVKAAWNTAEKQLTEPPAIPVPAGAPQAPKEPRERPWNCSVIRHRRLTGVRPGHT